MKGTAGVGRAGTGLAVSEEESPDGSASICPLGLRHYPDPALGFSGALTGIWIWDQAKPLIRGWDKHGT